MVQTVTIKDALGKIIYDNSFDCKTKELKINTTLFNQGLYITTVYFADVQLKSVKLSIVR